MENKLLLSKTLQEIKEDIEALEKSIKHWERIRLDPDEPTGNSSCALCQLAKGRTDPSGMYYACTGCPVLSRTPNDWGCDATPFTDYINAWAEDWKAYTEETEAARVVAANAELEFLRSLLAEWQVHLVTLLCGENK